jgi:hypothetical protein
MVARDIKNVVEKRVAHWGNLNDNNHNNKDVSTVPFSDLSRNLALTAYLHLAKDDRPSGTQRQENNREIHGE